MDGFTYHNIFETKGIEYLIIIAFLVLIVPFWFFINKNPNVTKKIKEAVGSITAGLLRIPQGLFYSKNHTWAFLEKSGLAKIGLDDFLMQVVGDVKVTRFREPGEMLQKGEWLAEIDQNGKCLKVFSPVSGKILKANTLLQDESGIINSDPYDNGWLYAIKPTQWVADTSKFYLAEEATQWIKSEVDRLKDFLASAMAKHTNESSKVALQEGGEIRKNVLSEMDTAIWQDFQKEFLE